MEPDAVEIRVLGCLIEKQRTTPDVYPLTLNALRLACNQSTNRDPVVDYDENTIRGAIERLVHRKWATLASWSNRRSMKYRQTLDRALELSDAEIAVLARADAARPADAGRAEDAHRAAALLRRHGRAGRDARRADRTRPRRPPRPPARDSARSATRSSSPRRWRTERRRAETALGQRVASTCRVPFQRNVRLRPQAGNPSRGPGRRADPAHRAAARPSCARRSRRCARSSGPEAVGLARHRGPGRAAARAAAGRRRRACPGSGACRPRRSARASRSEDAVRRARRARSSAWRSAARAGRRRDGRHDGFARREIVTGEPAVPQDGPNTQYAELRWGEPAELVPAARRARSARACCCAPAGYWVRAGEPAARTPRARALAAGSGRGASGATTPSSRRPRSSGWPTPPWRGCASAARRPTTAWPRGSPPGTRGDGRLRLELQPVRWALRLLERRLATASPRSAWCAPRTAAGSRAAAPAGCRAGRAAGRSARAARSTSARAPPRRSRASFTRSGGCEPRRPVASRRSRACRTASTCWSGWPPSPNAASPCPTHEHDEWAWWPRRHRRLAAPRRTTASS